MKELASRHVIDHKVKQEKMVSDNDNDNDSAE